MFGHRRSRRSTPPRPQPALEDIRVASAWDLTPAQWNGLTDFERQECRRNITTAPRFVP